MIAAAGSGRHAGHGLERDPQSASGVLAYLTDLLNKLGFKATLKVIQDSVYFQTVGNQSLNAQAGFADWSQDFPNPSDFYLLLSKAGIQATNNENFGNVDDPKIESQLATLQPIPASQLPSQQAGWTDAGQVRRRQQSTWRRTATTPSPKFMSNRVDFADAVFNSVNYMEFSHGVAQVAPTWHDS